MLDKNSAFRHKITYKFYFICLFMTGFAPISLQSFIRTEGLVTGLFLALIPLVAIITGVVVVVARASG